MKISAPVAAAVAGLMTTLTSVPVAHADATRVPNSTEVAITQVTPSGLGSGGQFQVQLTLLNPVDVCGFTLYRYTSARGTQYLGSYSGTKTKDLASPSWGYTYYYAYPRDCSWNYGDATFSEDVYPTTRDESSAAYVVNGIGSRVTQSGAYGNDVLRTTSRSARVRFSTGYAFNNALAVTTGPAGGVGTVYVNGVRKGTINFYSSTVKNRKVLFKFGAGSAAYRNIDIVQTGTGARGGVQMYLDALAGIDDA
jgi:hypothetical protein